MANIYPNCTSIPAEANTDAGVAGAGVLLSFIITAGAALIMSSIIILREARGGSESKILRKLLLSFSDQQMITGIGIQSIGLAKMQTMIPYHFFIIWMLSLLSTATHISALLALNQNFKRDWVLRWLREFFMFVNLVLSCASGIFVLMSVMKDLAPTLPIGCVWEVEDHKAASNSAVSIAGTIAVMAGQLLFFALAVWYLHIKHRGWLKIVQIAGMLVLFAMGAGAAIRVILLSQAFGTASVPLRDNGEKEWSFGQLLSLLLLLLPFISCIEIVRGKSCHHCGRKINTDKKRYKGKSKFLHALSRMIKFHSQTRTESRKIDIPFNQIHFGEDACSQVTDYWNDDTSIQQTIAPSHYYSSQAPSPRNFLREKEEQVAPPLWSPSDSRKSRNRGTAARAECKTIDRSVTANHDEKKPQDHKH